MLLAKFKGLEIDTKLSIPLDEFGIVRAQETRQVLDENNEPVSKAYVTVLFSTAEVNGVPAEWFDFHEAPDEV